jgi:Domain of unknown function (DUF4259)
MGIWGAGPRDNDTAVDWMYGLGEVADMSLIEGTIDRALAIGDGYLEAADAQEALAAAECVARLLGNFGPRTEYSRTMDDWVSWMPEKPTLELLTKAWRIVARVRQPPSELLELWAGSGKAEDWSRSLADLTIRLGA